MNVIIPLCGKGERFAKSYINPKPLIKVHNKEIIFYILDNIYNDTSIEKDVYIIINKNTNCTNIKEIIHLKYQNVKFIDIIEETRGAAETIQIGINSIRNIIKYNNLFVLDGDNFYTINIFQLISLNDNGIIYFKDDSIIEQYSYIEIDKNDSVINIMEKSKISNNANTGAYFFKNIKEFMETSFYVIENNIMFKNEFYMSVVIKNMLDTSTFKAIEIEHESYVSLGTPELVNSYIDSTYGFLFDLDGTLIISDHIYIKAWNNILEKYNILVDEEFFNLYIQGNTDQDVIKKLLTNIEVDIDSISFLKDTYFLENLHQIIVIPGAIDFIKYIKQKGDKVAIITNCNRIIATKVLDFLNINNIVDLLIVGNECNKPKPYPDPYIKAMNYFNILPNKCFIFEDSQTGFLSAKHSYPECIICVDYFYKNNNILTTDGVNIIINNFEKYKTIYEEIISFNKIDQDNNYNKEIHQCLEKLYDVKYIDCKKCTLKGGYISDVIEVDMFLKNNEIIHMILKKENKTENIMSTMAKKLCLYEREYYFYESLSKYVNINIPKFYGIVRNDSLKKIGILLENLNTSNYELNINLNKKNIDVILKYISTISLMHAKFTNKILTTEFKGLYRANYKELNSVFICDFVKEKCDIFIKKWKFMLKESQIHQLILIVSKFDKIQDKLSEGTLTLCHGDFKSPNIFCKVANNDYEPCLIDWQYICEGKGVQDIIFFMIESFDSLFIKDIYIIIIEYYYNKLCEYGVKNYTKSEYMSDITYSICYFPILVCLWFGTMDQEELIDKNFPYIFLKKTIFFLDNYVDKNILNNI